MAGLDSINSGAGSGSGYQPGRDDKQFNPKTSDPFADAPFSEQDKSGSGQGDGRASGLPGTPFKAQKPNPQDGGGHKKFAGASHEAWSNIPGGGSAGKPKIPGAGGGGPAGAAGKAGGGKAAFAQKAAEGLQQGLDKLQQGDIVGGAKDAVKGAAGAAGDLAADKLFYVMIQWALQTFTLSILIGWNLLLLLPWVIGAITGVKISLQLWQKAVIIAMDAIIVGIILLLLIIFTVTFCYGVTGKEFSLTAFSVNPVGYVAGQAAQYVLPQEVVDFCSSVSGTKTGDFGGGATDGNAAPSGPIVASGCSTKESGGCTRNTISACPQMAAQMENSLRACNQESEGGQVAIASGTDKCQLPSGEYISFSIGLWQINMLDSTQPEFPECKDALILTGKDPNRCVTRIKSGKCIVTYRSCKFGSNGQAGYNACKTALSDPVRNTKQACTLFNKRQWGPWPHTKKVCALP